MGLRSGLLAVAVLIMMGAATAEAKFRSGAEDTIGPIRFENLRWLDGEPSVLTQLRRCYAYAGWQASDGRHHFRGSFFGWPNADITPAFWGERLYRVEVLLPYPPTPQGQLEPFVRDFFDRLGTRFGGTSMRDTLPDARFLYRQLGARGQLDLAHWRLGGYDRPTPEVLGNWHLPDPARKDVLNYLNYWSTELLVPAGVPDGYEFVFETLPVARVLTGRATAVGRPDLVTVRLPGKTEQVRLIGLGPQGAWSPAALARARELMAGRTVHCELEEQTRDQQGHLLAHVFTGPYRVIREEDAWPIIPRVSGNNVNAVLLREGLARHAHALPNIHRFEEYEAAQDQAKNTHRGIWAAPGR